VAIPECTDRVERHSWGEDFDPSSSKAGGTVAPQFGIDEDRSIDAEILAKCPCELGTAVADNPQVGTEISDLLYRVTQLRDLLTAEDSTKVSNEEEDRRFLRPGLSECDCASIEVVDLDRTYARREGAPHLSRFRTAEDSGLRYARHGRARRHLGPQW
jgi:hypothetical protein